MDFKNVIMCKMKMHVCPNIFGFVSIFVFVRTLKSHTTNPQKHYINKKKKKGINNFKRSHIFSRNTVINTSLIF